jgi:hypothetical protein
LIYEGERYDSSESLLDALGRVESVMDVQTLDRAVRLYPEAFEAYKGVLNYIRMRNVAQIMGREYG